MLRRLIVVAIAIAAATALSVAQAPQGPQSRGALGARPGAERQPEFPPPTIVDYKPRTTLVVPQHPVPRAKYPVIDIHSHQPAPIQLQQLETVVKSMDPLNLQILVNASGASGDRLVQSVAAIKNSPFKDRMVMFTNIGFNNVGPGYGKTAAAQLEQDVKNGAMGWEQLSVQGAAPAAARRVRIGLVFHAAGTAWFDDVEVTRETKAPQ